MIPTTCRNLLPHSNLISRQPLQWVSKLYHKPLHEAVNSHPPKHPYMLHVIALRHRETNARLVVFQFLQRPLKDQDKAEEENSTGLETHEIRTQKYVERTISSKLIKIRNQRKPSKDTEGPTGPHQDGSQYPTDSASVQGRDPLAASSSARTFISRSRCCLHIKTTVITRTTKVHNLATSCEHHSRHLPDVFLMLSNQRWVWMWKPLPLQQHLTLQLFMCYSLCWELPT